MEKTDPRGLPETSADPADIVDLRGLEAPEPMVRILAACAKLADGESLNARLPHIPFPVFPHLAARGLAWETEELADGSAIIRIRPAS